MNVYIKVLYYFKYITKEQIFRRGHKSEVIYLMVFMDFLGIGGFNRCR